MTCFLVIPYYNEEQRFDGAGVAELCADDLLHLVLVDDGSTDGTLELLRGLSRSYDNVDVLALPSNVGKGEAVRAGMQLALEQGASVAGYADADFATPAAEIRRLARIALDDPSLSGVLGSRVLLKGRTIDRRPLRHYLGRVVATYLDVRVQLGVYDTQCGMKFFRAQALRPAVDEPFATRWLFDVELLQRLLVAGASTDTRFTYREEPLERWADVRGSHLQRAEVLRVLRDFARLDALFRGPKGRAPNR